MMFSVTVITGTSWKCWCTIPMPRAIASAGSLIGRSSPATRIVPESGRIRPKICLTSVDLPAPFSPSSATTSPRSMCRVMSVFAWTDPKDLLTPSMSSSRSPTVRCGRWGALITRPP